MCDWKKRKGTINNNGGDRETTREAAYIYVSATF